MTISREDVEAGRIDFADIAPGPASPPVHPGEILADWLADLDLKPSTLARRIGVPRNRITQIVKGERPITADTSIRLGRYFEIEPGFWYRLQAGHDLEAALRRFEGAA